MKARGVGEIDQAIADFMQTGDPGRIGTPYDTHSTNLGIDRLEGSFKGDLVLNTEWLV